MNKTERLQTTSSKNKKPTVSFKALAQLTTTTSLTPQNLKNQLLHLNYTKNFSTLRKNINQ
jgi:hypothetical protein